MATRCGEKNGGPQSPSSSSASSSSPRAPTTTPGASSADMAAENLNQLGATRRQQKHKDRNKARKQRRKLRGKDHERVDAAVAAAAVGPLVESAARETAAAAAAPAPAAAAPAAPAAAVVETAEGGGAAPALISPVAVLEAVALAVEIEAEARPSSSSSLTKLKDTTNRLLLACRGLKSTVVSTAAAVAAREASVAAEVAAAACAASEELDQEVAEQDRIRIQESLKEKRAAEDGKRRRAPEASITKGTMKPRDLDDGSHDSGSTCSKTASSESTTAKGGRSEGTRGEGQQYRAPLSADATPYPMPVQEVQEGVYLVNVRGTYYPTGMPPPPSLLWQGQASDQSYSWVQDGNNAAVYQPQMKYEHQQQATGYYGGSVQGVINPTPSWMQPQAFEYGGGGVAGVCPLPTGPYMQQQAFAYGDEFASVCPTPALSVPPYAAPPMAYGGTTYYPCQMMPYVRAGV